MYKVKVQGSIVNVCTVYPAQAIVGAGSSIVISLKFEVQKVEEKGLDLTSGHRIHVESWSISHEDAAKSDSAKLLAAIKKKVDSPRKPDTSRIQIRYTPSATLYPVAQPIGASPLPFRKLSHSAVSTVAPLSGREYPVSDNAGQPTDSLMSNAEPTTAYGRVSKFVGLMLNPWRSEGNSLDHTPVRSVGPAAKRYSARDRVSTDPLAIVPPRVEQSDVFADDELFSFPQAKPRLSRPARPRSTYSSIPGFFPDATEEQWMPYIPVNGVMRGRVKVPEVSSSGGFSDVYRCEARFATYAETNPRAVAVKRMVGRLAREITTWSTIAHPNVAPILGFAATPLVSLISPWYEKGNVRDYLKTAPNADRLKLSLDIAKGLAYLHSRTPEIVHGDLKSNNVLITNEDDAMLSDFGLSRIMEENPQWTPPHREAGSVRWMAPELLLDKERESYSADVWSFGMVMFEVMTGNVPYSDLPASKLWTSICDPDNPKDPVEDWDKYSQLPDPIKEMMVKYAEKLTNSTLDFTRGHYLLIESWRISQDTGTDAMLLLAEIRSKGDKAPKPSLSEFFIRYDDPGPAQQIPSSLQRSSANSAAIPIESPSPPRTCSQSSISSLQNIDSTNTSGRSRDVPSSTVEGTSTRFAQSASEVQASVEPIGPSRGEYPLKNGLSRFVLADGGSGDYVIAVDDIVIQGTDPYDVTGHFSDLFIGIHKGDVKVAMKRLRIGKRSSHGHEIE
ncbi:hypothetical protein FRC04_001647, partial [Tulasnella sp. 424]